MAVDESNADDEAIQEFAQLSAEHVRALEPFAGNPDPGWGQISDVPEAD